MSAAAKVLERARQMGVTLEACGGRIAYDAPYALLTAELAETLRQHKAEILELLRRERREFPDLATAPEARAGWLSAPIGTLSPSRVPHHWPAARWPQLVADAETFCRDWAEKALLLGWAEWELFGCHRRAPWGRIQGMGLVLLLQGDEIAALTATEAVIRTSTGAHQTYRRNPADPLHPAERCLVWELQDA
jgi:TubC N-terminal docking domain